MSPIIFYLLIIIGIFIGGFALIIWLVSEEPVTLPRRIVAAITGLSIIVVAIFLMIESHISLKFLLVFLIAGVGLIALVTFTLQRQKKG